MWQSESPTSFFLMQKRRWGGVVKLVDTRDLGSREVLLRTGSNPVSPNRTHVKPTFQLGFAK